MRADAVSDFATARIPPAPSGTAPDGTDVRPLLSLSGGSFAHFELPPGSTSSAVMHRTVEEIWFFLGGRGEMWRLQVIKKRWSRWMLACASPSRWGRVFSFARSGTRP